MTQELAEPREPDLPPAAWVRPKALPTGWTTGTCATTTAVLILTGELR
jgi:cobalt-precorrin-5B (C1)-methyltransferase